MSDQSTAPTNARGNKPAPADGRDPAVKMPSRVRAEAERAEALMKANQIEPAPPAPTPEGKEDIGITLAAPPAATPPTNVQPNTPPANAQELQKPSENDFNAMKGRFERANRDASKLSEEVTNLRNVIATLQAAPAPNTPPTAQTPPELRAESLLTPQEISDYGPEFLEVVGKKAREIAGAEISQLKQQIDNLSRGMQATTQVTLAQGRDVMLAALDDKLPEWRDINNDQNFLAWLRLPDPFSGAIRHDLLKAAYDQNNTARVSAFFQGFLAEEAAVAPANNVPPVSPGATPARVPLETFAAPGRAKSAAASAPVEKPIITRAQVTAFYADVASGKYRGREAEKDRLEAEIFSATNEGRLR